MDAGDPALLNSTMLELSVLGGLILIRVVSICLLRYSEHAGARKPEHTGSSAA
jgi:hypothetical protein